MYLIWWKEINQFTSSPLQDRQILLIEHVHRSKIEMCLGLVELPLMVEGDPSANMQHNQPHFPKLRGAKYTRPLSETKGTKIHPATLSEAKVSKIHVHISNRTIAITRGWNLSSLFHVVTLKCTGNRTAWGNYRKIRMVEKKNISREHMAKRTTY